MSDLLGGGSGRAANNGARAAAGPVPVQPRSGGVRTPRDIMNDRQAREARRREQEDTARQAEQREQQQAQEDEARRAAERRAAAAGVAAPYQRDTGRSGANARPTADSGYMTGEQSKQQSGRPENLTPGKIQGSEGATGSRTRASSLSQQQPRAAVPQQQPAQASSSRVPGTLPRLPTSTAPQQPHARTSSAPAQSIPKPTVDPSQPQPQARTSNVSSFPHAFERWETLSSHWEGLTSYWIRRLEANTEEVRREPLAQQMSRQITDLSAAGANLFHAVVELQRLRASSERKFQRWFFETKQEQERMREVQAELERSLAAERAARKDAEQRAERAERDKNVDSKKTSEIRRELQISVEEARRAWEELGRREQEERDRTMSLREGHPTLVGGVQVVPMQAAMSRHGSTSQRPSTQERATEQDPQMRQHFSYEDQSPTDTDPYASAAARGATSALRHEPDAPSMGQAGYATYPSGSTPATSSSTHTTIPAEQSTALGRAQVPTSQASQQSSRMTAPPISEPSSPEAFYTHAGTYLTTTQGGQSSTSQQSHQQRQQHAAVSEPGDDVQSYIPSVEGGSEISDEEYEIDGDGNYVLDAHGHPVPYRPPRRSVDSDGDSYDVQAELDREREHAQRYGTQAGQRYPTATAAAGPTSAPSGTEQPDYEGQGYGQGSYEWAGVQRHHHPTRLSDVLEEDERSRTSPSRGSQRGQFGGGLG